MPGKSRWSPCLRQGLLAPNFPSCVQEASESSVGVRAHCPQRGGRDLEFSLYPECSAFLIFMDWISRESFSWYKRPHVKNCHDHCLAVRSSMYHGVLAFRDGIQSCLQYPALYVERNFELPESYQLPNTNRVITASKCLGIGGEGKLNLGQNLWRAESQKGPKIRDMRLKNQGV